jgi:hypothetical protein
MNVVIGLVIIALAAAYVAAPFFAPEAATEWSGSTQGPGTRQKLERQKLDAYAAIKEAEFDYRMGKLSDADFAALRGKYSAQALEAIAALDTAQSAAARHSSGPRRPSRIAFCPACGHAVPARANFCPACGRSLKEAVA